MNIPALIQCDFYKQNHYAMYPKNMTFLYSNFTPRRTRIEGVNEVVMFGLQYFIKEYLISQWDNTFFHVDKERVLREYKRMMDNTLGKDVIDVAHIASLWDLGYLPLEIKGLPEGELCPIGVPCITIKNTHPNFAWLVNFLETIISCTIWQAMTSATIAHQYRKLLNKYAIITTGTTDGVEWQGHDFSERGMSSLESACISAAGHLLSLRGTDTIAAISWLESYYNADVEKELVGSSVPATEHSVMCAGTQEDEVGTFKALLDKFPKGILSVVSDTWDLWKVCCQYLPELKEDILARDGKLVIRPDSGDPVDIICGTFKGEYVENERHKFTGEERGVIELLWSVFGGSINSQGYKVLDSHIGAIYGDSITLDRALQICERLKDKGFASTNIVLGIGSYTYQYNTRDTFGFAMKATYCELFIEGKGIERRDIFKSPITDDGTKNSAKGLLAVFKGPLGKYELCQQIDWEAEKKGELKTVFLNGLCTKDWTLQEVRDNLAKHTVN